MSQRIEIERQVQARPCSGLEATRLAKINPLVGGDLVICLGVIVDPL